jgi:hypothetical protein
MRRATEAERTAIVAYCETVYEATREVLPAIRPDLVGMAPWAELTIERQGDWINMLTVPSLALVEAVRRVNGGK